MKKLRKRKILLKALTIYYPLQTNFRHREGPWVLSLVGIYFLFFVNQSWVISGTAGPGGLWQVLSWGCHGASIAEAALAVLVCPLLAPLRRQQTRQLRPPRPARARGRVPGGEQQSVSNQLKFPRWKSSLSVGKSKTKVTVLSEISELGSLLYRPQPYKYSDQTSMIR